MLGDSRFWATYLVIFILLSLSVCFGVIWVVNFLEKKEVRGPFSVKKHLA